jgi:hypothetical protein
MYITLRSAREIIVAVDKQLSIEYSECVSVDLVIQRAKRMRLVVLSSVASLKNTCSTIFGKSY